MTYIYNTSTRVRVTGLASGFDTDALIKSIMDSKSVPLIRLKQQKILNEWKQESYKEITNALKSFNDAFLNLTNPSGNMRSASNYKIFNPKVVNLSGIESKSVSVSANSSYQGQVHIIKVLSLATNAREESLNKVSNLSSEDLTDKLIQGLDLSGKKIDITIDGTKKTLTFSEEAVFQDGQSLENALQSMINDAFGKGVDGLDKVKVTFDNTSGKLSFDTVEGSGSVRVTLNSSGDNSALSDLLIKKGSSNRISTSSTLQSLANSFKNPLQFENVDDEDIISFKINDKEFTFSKEARLSDILNTINSDKEANVTITYNSTTDKFTIVSDSTGAGKNIKIENLSGNFFDALGLDISNDTFGANGKDAVAVIDGVTISSSSNTIVQDGVSYTLNKADGEELNVSFTQDVDAAYDKIKNFIDEYNKILTLINTKTREKYDKSYTPLTDEQKRSMSEKEVELWESKAKTGLLYNDSTLTSIANNLRTAMNSIVEGAGITLSRIGIESKSYRDNGVLTIDEEKLKKALSEDLEGVTQLFSKVSDQVPSYTRKLNAEEKNVRFKESGLATRIYDIIQDNISILRDSNGNKGRLIQKAGIDNDSSMTENEIYNILKDIDNKIFAWEEKLMKIEDDLYAKYAKMEEAMNKLNATSNWLNMQIDAWNSTKK